VRGLLFPQGFTLLDSGSDKIRVTLSLPELRIERRAGLAYYLDFDDGERLGVDNAPDLPVFRRLVAVPDGGEVAVVAHVKAKTVVRGIEVRNYRRSAHDPSMRWSTQSSGIASAPPLPRGMFPEMVASIDYVGHRSCRQRSL